ncbi:MAG: threonine dehydratase, partial [Proteobacteria bacterium]|nr:threonine dehydratase [Pseudomonadota bacterium]
SVLIGIETTAPENFDRLFAHLDDAGFTYADITNDETVAQFVI